MAKASSINVREYILENRMIRRDIVNSIKDDEFLLEKAIDRVFRKKPYVNSECEKILVIYNVLRVNNLSGDLSCNKRSVDEWAKSLGQFNSMFPSDFDISNIKYVSGNGIEFDFSTRDVSFIKLGQTFGDCTAERSNQQRSEEHVENIYWTVFSWIFDLNYQVFRVFYNGKPIIKCHILPLMISSSGSNRDSKFFLFVDAIETTLSDASQVSDFLEENNLSHDWLDNLFSLVVDELLLIADRMGIRTVYCEKFSNTYWIRDSLSKMDEIFLNTRNIIKIDELEDVYECAVSFMKKNDIDRCVNNIFMELQARNTYLLPDFVIGSYKGFAVLRGDPKDGLPLKSVYGI